MLSFYLQMEKSDGIFKVWNSNGGALILLYRWIRSITSSAKIRQIVLRALSQSSQCAPPRLLPCNILFVLFTLQYYQIGVFRNFWFHRFITENATFYFKWHILKKVNAGP